MTMLLTTATILAHQLRAPGPVSLWHLPTHNRGAAAVMEDRLGNYVVDSATLKIKSNMVLVRPGRRDDRTSGGLFVAAEEETTKVRTKIGIVVKAGPGAVNSLTGEVVPCPVKEGDVVMMSATGEVIDYNGVRHEFVDADTLLGVFAEQMSSSVAHFTPLFDGILVSTKEEEEQTTSGIALAGVDESELTIEGGEVISIGEGWRPPLGDGPIPPPLVPGDFVLYGARAGIEVEIGNKPYKVLSELEIMGKSSAQ